MIYRAFLMIKTYQLARSISEFANGYSYFVPNRPRLSCDLLGRQQNLGNSLVMSLCCNTLASFAVLL